MGRRKFLPAIIQPKDPPPVQDQPLPMPKLLVISHSIKKYPEHSTTSSSTYYTKNVWTKETAEKYIEELKKKGYIPGVAVQTRWRTPAILGAFKEIPEAGLEFWGMNGPPIFSLISPNISPNIFYTEQEIIIDEQPNPPEGDL